MKPGCVETNSKLVELWRHATGAKYPHRATIVSTVVTSSLYGENIVLYYMVPYTNYTFKPYGIR